MRRQPKLPRLRLAIALAALFGAASAFAAPPALRFDPDAPQGGPAAVLADTDLMVEADGGVELKPGEFRWLPAAQIRSDAPVTVMVNIAEQRGYVYRDARLIAVTTVSTGKPGHDTPTGVFEILEKKKVHHSNRYEDNSGRPAAMPFMQRLTWEGVAMHAGRIPGTPASHGCVRLPKEFAAQLFTLTQRGDNVVVSEDGTLESLARAGVDMQRALRLGTSGTLHSFADAFVGDEPREAEPEAGAVARNTAF